MNVKVLFIGSIGTVAETSELQRQAYNESLKENGIEWNWNIDVYKKLLTSSGGQDRLQTLSEATNSNLDQEHIKKIHKRKTEIAGQKIIDNKIAPRAGLIDIIDQAKKDDVKVAWVTTTGSENTDAILTGSDGILTKEYFDHIFHREDAENGKPAPDIYKAALKHYGIHPNECIAIEDSLNSVLSSKGAGIFTVVTPGDYHSEHLENIANVVLESLEQTDWRSLKSSFKKSN